MTRSDGPERPAPLGDPTVPSLQERYFPDLPCFGCGPANPRGLRLRSYEGPGDAVVADFAGWPEHDNGLGFLNGGIIATVLDCHSAAAVTHRAHQEGWPPLGELPLPYVTAGLDVRYLRPTPREEPVRLVAEILAADEGTIDSQVRLEWDGKVRAEANARWKRWRPRP